MNPGRQWVLWMIGCVFFAMLLSSITYTYTTSDRMTISYKKRDNSQGDTPLITYFMMDGFSHQVFSEELQAGNLPHMQRLIDTGAKIKQGLTCFPSVTAYAFFPMLTGQTAPQSEVYGLRWFDRNRTENNLRSYIGAGFKYMNGDLTSKYKLLFEEMTEYYTFSANTYLNRGVKTDIKTPLYMATAKYGPVKWYFRLLKLFGSYGYRDWLGLEDYVMEQVIKDAVENRPKLQWVTMASPDGSCHTTGRDEMYKEIVRNCDRLIGEYIDAVEKDGSMKDRLIAIVSDHGVVDVTKNLDLIEIFTRNGMKAYEPPSISTPFGLGNNGISWYSKQELDVYAGINGNNVVYVYMSNPDFRTPENTGSDWQVRLAPEQIVNYPSRSGIEGINLFNVLRCEAGVGHVMGRSARTHESFILGEGDNFVVEVHDCSSTALIHKHNDKWAYVAVESSQWRTDPFEYLSDTKVSHKVRNAVLNGEYLTLTEWMEGTINGEYPNGPPFVEEILNMPLCADLVLTNAPGWDFGKDYEWFVYNNRGGHGGIHRNQTIVPMILSGWGIKPGSNLDFASTADMGATIRHIAGLSDIKATGRILSDIVDEELIKSKYEKGLKTQNL